MKPFSIAPFGLREEGSACHPSGLVCLVGCVERSEPDQLIQLCFLWGSQRSIPPQSVRGLYSRGWKYAP